MAGHFQNIVLCEHVTKDVGGKYSAIGIYSGDILVGELPSHLRLALLLVYVPSETGPFRMEFELVALDEIFLKGKSTFENAIAGQPISISIPSFTLDVPRQTEVVAFACVGKGKKEEILRKSILLNPDVTPEMIVSQK